jgi:hypothetical protein
VFAGILQLIAEFRPLAARDDLATSAPPEQGARRKRFRANLNPNKFVILWTSA